MAMPQMPHPKGYRWSQFARLVFATYGDTCIVCFHGGAQTVDHLESITEKPELAWTLGNCRPIHAAPFNICRKCGMNCNGIKGGYSIERARRVWAERTGTVIPPPPKPKEEPGRIW